MSGDAAMRLDSPNCSCRYFVHGMRELVQAAYGREHKTQRREQEPERTDKQRMPNSDRLRDGAARQRSQWQNAVVDQVHGGIYTAQEMIRCNRLAQAPVIDVVYRPRQVADLRRDQKGGADRDGSVRQRYEQHRHTGHHRGTNESRAETKRCMSHSAVKAPNKPHAPPTEMMIPTSAA